ncbi:MAG TPA: periplasmic heavy metal sensor, partial [Polyangiales bacterium]|nr:periplasmic heavy metal sensor [Polyangiales bacterium]
ARLRERLGAVRNAREEVRAALTREPYDPAQLEAALAKLRQRSNEIQEDMHRTLVEGAQKLSVEERRRLAESRLFSRPIGLPP